jgi:hypothetical protein
MFLLLLTAREVPPCADPGLLPNTTPTGPSASSPAASAPVCIDAGTATHHGVKTGGIAALLDRRQQVCEQCCKLVNQYAEYEGMTKDALGAGE